MIVTNKFDQAILDAFTYQKLVGFIAHISPFIRLDSKDTPSKIWWKKIFDKAGLSLPPFNNVHTVWGLMNKDERHRSCLYYYNYGLIFSPTQFVEQMAQTFLSLLAIIEKLIETPFKAQY